MSDLMDHIKPELKSLWQKSQNLYSKIIIPWIPLIYSAMTLLVLCIVFLLSCISPFSLYFKSLEQTPASCANLQSCFACAAAAPSSSVRALARCRENQRSWQLLHAPGRGPEQQCSLVSAAHSHSQPCIRSALHWISRREAAPVSVLVTGSLYLVGGVLQLLDPSLDS